MKLKFKLGLLVIAIMAVVVAGISAILLRQASAISVDLSRRSLRNLAIQRAEFWKGREEGYIRVLRTLASVMSDYEHIPVGQRRDRFDQILMAAIISEQNLLNLYSVWKPDAVDGLDVYHTGRIGSGPSGQYAMAYTRETGAIQGRTTTDIDGAMAYINGPDSKKERVEHPFPRAINGKEVHVIRMMVPIIDPHTNETVGGVGCLLNIAVIQETTERIMAENREISAMAIYSGNGRIMASYRPERVGKMLLEADTGYGSAIQDANRAVLAGKEFSTKQYVPALGTSLEMIVYPLTIGNSDTTWSIMIASEESYILAEVRSMTKFTIILAAIAMLAAAAVIFLVLGYVTKPIVKVTETLRDISEGEGDLTHVIEEKGNDEIADLARYFNRTLEKIKNLVVTIKERVAELSNIGGELAINMTETAAAINEITSTIQSIKGRVINQSASLTETNATMGQITSNIDRLNGHVGLQSESVSKSSLAIEQMLSNIRSVTQTLVKNSNSVGELSSASESGRAGLQNVAGDIQEISKQSQGLLEINNVMKNIASQTNLLSMNAAIEAAHAGEAGKGFAVVAGEIRKLAEDSGEQSRTISAALKKIKSTIDKITESTGVVLTRFAAIDSGVKIVSDQEASILGAMREQDDDSKQIVEAVEQLNKITGQVKNSAMEMLEGSREVIRESQNLEQVTEEITGGMNEMAVGAEQINQAVNRVNEISGKNKDNIALLVKEVGRFKV
ncbi:MAG: methyl-accepting chemotaxis protein [Treponema sp.]|nr:methyl-accepting chemotaxis protein [Treponema sp.]